jgi:hypothetical protein
MKHRYTLEPYKTIKSRYRCPACGKAHCFSRYIDTHTGEHLADHVGRCNREISCAYHFTPRKFHEQNGMFTSARPGKTTFTRREHKKPFQRETVVKPEQFSCIPKQVFEKSLAGYQGNHFVKYLCSLFGADMAKHLCHRYHIGSSNHWTGATVFWQLDASGKARTGKIMLYNANTGKRVKEPINHITWAHTALKMPAFVLQQCLFGEHLLQSESKPVAVVESEKTAIIASVYRPMFTWVAVGSLNNLNRQKLQVLKDRQVILYPDLNAFEKWNTKARELKGLCKITVSDLLERNATQHDHQQGLDIADYLVRLNRSNFTGKQTREQFEARINALFPSSDWEPVIWEKREAPVAVALPNWNERIAALETFFASCELPSTLQLDACTFIGNVAAFVARHLSVVRAQNGNLLYLPYLERLEGVRAKLVETPCLASP